VDHESPELIERQMLDTRESLTEKVSLLEQQVVGKIQSATEAVQETVQSVRSAVEDTVATVTDSVKASVETVSEALDVRQRVRETPWLMVGGVAAAGFITGLFVFRRSTSAAHAPTARPEPFVGFAPSQEMPRRSTWLDGILDMVGQECKTLTERAIATASASLKETMATAIPKLIESAVPDRLPSRDTPRPMHSGNGRAAYSDVQG